MRRTWLRITSGVVLLVAGVLVAAFPSMTDLRYAYAQERLAAESGGGQTMPAGAVARLAIPDIGLDAYVLEGTTPSVLNRGPGHFPGTPLPGENGNSAIAGHRTMYGHPFNRLHELEPGDEIRTYTDGDSATYRVSAVEIHKPSDTYVAANTQDDRLTLTTCNPIGSARQRLVVIAMMEE